MRAIVSLTNNCGTNTGRAYWSWSTETADTSLLSVSFLMDPDLYPFLINCLLLSVPNINDAQ